MRESCQTLQTPRSLITVMLSGQKQLLCRASTVLEFLRPMCASPGRQSITAIQITLELADAVMGSDQAGQS